MAGLPYFPAFDPNAGHTNAFHRWVKWLKRFENMLKVLDIEESEQKCAFLFHYVGEQVCNIFDSLEGTGDEKDYDTAKAKLTEYFRPRQNTVMEIMQFRQAKQHPNETINQYHARLQTLSTYCGFSNKDEEIKQQIIETCTLLVLRQRALELADEESTLAKVLDIARIIEICGDNTSNDVNQGRGAIAKIERSQGTPSKRKQQPTLGYNSRKCHNCGGCYPHHGGVTACPAYGRKCRECGKVGHYGIVCNLAVKKSLATINSAAKFK
ncbi:uncharacterized protein [Procambarus clarkii]|uniref:uncharacterized protein n=1 Tax=Procambarus clarkii TaxID=6728 RepID=UPI003744347E